MTLTGWGLLLSFAGAIVLAVTAFQLRTPQIQRWDPVLGWVLLALGFALQLGAELLR